MKPATIRPLKINIFPIFFAFKYTGWRDTGSGKLYCSETTFLVFLIGRFPSPSNNFLYTTWFRRYNFSHFAWNLPYVNPLSRQTNVGDRIYKLVEMEWSLDGGLRGRQHYRSYNFLFALFKFTHELSTSRFITTEIESCNLQTVTPNEYSVCWTS